MFNIFKIVGVAVAGGAVLGALGSQKVGSFLRRDEAKARAKRTAVKIVEVPVDTDDPDNLDFVIIKRTKQNKTKE